MLTKGWPLAVRRYYANEPHAFGYTWGHLSDSGYLRGKSPVHASEYGDSDRTVCHPVSYAFSASSGGGQGLAIGEAYAVSSPLKVLWRGEGVDVKSYCLCFVQGTCDPCGR